MVPLWCAVLCRLLSEGHVAFLETVPFKAIAFFTVLQFIGLAAVYVVSSWTGVSAPVACILCLLISQNLPSDQLRSAYQHCECALL